MACHIASMAQVVGSSLIRGVLRTRSTTSVLIGGAVIGATGPKGPAPGVMKLGGQVPRMVKPRGFRGRIVKADVVEGRDGVAGGAVTNVLEVGGAVAGGTTSVVAIPLGLMTIHVLPGAEARLMLLLPLEPSGSVMKTSPRRWPGEARRGWM